MWARRWRKQSRCRYRIFIHICGCCLLPKIMYMCINSDHDSYGSTYGEVLHIGGGSESKIALEGDGNSKDKENGQGFAGWFGCGRRIFWITYGQGTIGAFWGIWMFGVLRRTEINFQQVWHLFCSGMDRDCDLAAKVRVFEEAASDSWPEECIEIDKKDYKA